MKQELLDKMGAESNETRLAYITYFYGAMGFPIEDLPAPVKRSQQCANALARALAPAPDILLRIDRLHGGKNPRGAAYEIGFHTCWLDEELAVELLGDQRNAFFSDFRLGRTAGRRL